MANERSHLRTIVNEDGAVILNTTTGELVTVNSTGAFIWQALARGDALEIITANLASETGQEVDSLQHEVREFVGTLRKHKLVSR
jgi:Coenzyme PQQ synthesis protein D (PqqD)